MPAGASATPTGSKSSRRGDRRSRPAIARLDRLASERDLPDEIVRPLRAHQRDRLKHIEQGSDGDAGHKKLTDLHCDIELQLIEAERQHVNDLFRNAKLKDEARRRIERELDLREAQIANRRAEE